MQMVAYLAFHGPLSLRSDWKFQVAQGHTIGVGVKIDVSKAHYAFLFAVDGTLDDKSGARGHPILASFAERLTGVSHRAIGQLGKEIETWNQTLAKEPNEKYYSEKLRVYRAGTIMRLKSTALSFNPPLPAIGDWQGLSKYISEGNSCTGYVIIAETMLDITDLDNIPVMHFLCVIGDLVSVKTLIAGDNGAELLASEDDKGNSALHFACMGGQRGIALHLVLERSVTTSKPNNVGTLPLHWLSMFPDKDIDSMSVALSYTENDNMVSKGLQIPLHFLWLRGPSIHWAVSCRNRTAVQSLLKHGANIDEEYQGYTALAKAVELHTPEIVHVLLENGTQKSPDCILAIGLVILLSSASPASPTKRDASR
jgi:hypothetical protein